MNIMFLYGMQAMPLLQCDPVAASVAEKMCCGAPVFQKYINYAGVQLCMTSDSRMK